MAKRKVSPDQQKSNEAEALNRPIHPRGEGESQAVKALLDPDFAKLSDLNVTDIALLLQQIVRGQNSLLATAKDNGDEITRLKEKMAQTDATMERRFLDQKREIESVLNDADRLKATGFDKDKIIARGSQLYAEAIVQARVSGSLEKKQFEDTLNRQPKVLVVSPGVWETVREGTSLIPRISPEEIRIRHLRWLLQPGVPTLVPQAVAEQLANRRQSQQETSQRKEMLSKQMEQSKLATAWNAVTGSKTDTLPLA
jgi:hypothetical protein